MDVAPESDKLTLLLVDDEASLLPPLTALLRKDFHILTADSADAAQALVQRHRIDLILTDQRMPRRTGTQLLEWVRVHSPHTVRLLMTAYAELEDAVEAINRGHVYHYLPKPWRAEELLQALHHAADKYRLEREREGLIKELQALNAQLELRVRDRTRELEEANHLLHQHAHKLETLALTDPLTGLLNLRAINDMARKELKRHARYPSTLALGLVDVDHFKDINTRYLHPGGDAVLVNLAKILIGTVRTVDAVSRVGGEEFLVIAPETSLEGAQVLADRIRLAVEEATIEYNGQPIQITVSIGFAVAEPGLHPEYEILRHVAAAALGEAKARGRNCCVVKTLDATTTPSLCETIPGGVITGD